MGDSAIKKINKVCVYAMFHSWIKPKKEFCANYDDCAGCEWCREGEFTMLELSKDEPKEG